jgi:membrane protein DedA with SNARE-associated domain
LPEPAGREIFVFNMYTWIFILLILGGLGFPMPEELPLLIAGITASHGEISLVLAFIVCYVGVLVGDQTMYAFGYFFGRRILSAGTRSPFLPLVTEKRVNEVREGLRKRRLLYVLVGRHLFFLRSVTFVIAGSLHLPFKEFFIADAIAALLSVTVFITLGYWLGSSLAPELVTAFLRQANFYLAIILGVAAVGYAIYFKWFRVRAVEAEVPFTEESLNEEERA